MTSSQGITKEQDDRKRICTCGHTAHWHGDLGCEGAASCVCGAFSELDAAELYRALTFLYSRCTDLWDNEDIGTDSSLAMTMGTISGKELAWVRDTLAGKRPATPHRVTAWLAEECGC